MAEIRIRKRRRLRGKEVRAIAAEIRERTGSEHFGWDDVVDMASATEFDVLFVNGEIMAVVIEGMAFPTVRGILRHGAERGFVTVDMGAVPYLANGADVMAPGVVDADPGLREDDLVWVRDINNLRPLAIGRALMSGPAMVTADSGKAVRTLHHVGDRLWRYDEG